MVEKNNKQAQMLPFHCPAWHSWSIRFIYQKYLHVGLLKSTDKRPAYSCLPCPPAVFARIYGIFNLVAKWILVFLLQPTREVVAEKRPAESQPGADGADRKRRRLSPPRTSRKPSRFEDPVARLVPPEARVGAGDWQAADVGGAASWSGEASNNNAGIDEEERQRILRMVEEANPEVSLYIIALAGYTFKASKFLSQSLLVFQENISRWPVALSVLLEVCGGRGVCYKVLVC